MLYSEASKEGTIERVKQVVTVAARITFLLPLLDAGESKLLEKSRAELQAVRRSFSNKEEYPPEMLGSNSPTRP